MGRLVSVMVIMLLLTGASVLAPIIRLVRAEATSITVPGDYPTIQDAINNAVHGDTIFVKAGTYYEHVVVNKTVAIVGADVDTTIIDGNNTGHVIHVVSDNVTVAGFTVQNSGHIDWPALDAGICLNGTTDCVIAENRLVDIGFAGISLLDCEWTTVRGNNVTRVGWTAIHLMGSSYNLIADNHLTSNVQGGINGHAASHHNNITGNVITNSSIGMFYHNAHYNRLSKNHLTNIAVDGIQLQDNVNYNLVAENHLTNCSVGVKLLGPNHGNTLAGNVLTIGQSGIRIQNAGYTQIYNNTITRFYGAEWDAALRLEASGYSSIHSNFIHDNWRGILLYTSSPHVTIHRNTITDNEFAIRVASGGSSFLNITENTVMNNRGYGIGVTGFSSGSHYATISRNLIMNNSDGIALGQYSNYHRIFQNNITQNGIGFYVEYSTLNEIWGNSIVDNEQQVHVAFSPVNLWDAGYPVGGNYWRPFNGTDSASGPYQNETGRDGLGDAGYGVNSSPQTPGELVQYDNYPLMGPFHSFTTPGGGRVDIVSNSTVEGFECEPSSMIRFYVSNITANQTQGFCRVSIPHAALSEPFNVMVNGVAPTYRNFNLADNGTHRWIYFEYAHSTHEVIIVPEFPSSAILPLFMVLTLLAVMSWRRNHS